MIEACKAVGIFRAICRDRFGIIRWQDFFPNTVTTVGKNLALDTYLAGAAYTVTGPFMGLIALTGFSAISAADSMTSHAGWLEAGGANAPTYNTTRQLLAWSTASGGTKVSAPASYLFNGAGTVVGAFLVFGPSAVDTKDNTGGTLYSAGLFVQGNTLVANGDILSITYTAGL